MVRNILIIGLAGFSFAGQALAADFNTVSVVSLSTAKDAVMVARGGHVQPLLGASVLRNGDRVSISTGGHAMLSYADGCKVDMKSGSQVTVSAVSPCVSARTQFRTVQGNPNDDNFVTLPVVGSTSLAGALIGGGAVIGFGLIAAGSAGAFESTPNNSFPSSPVSP